MNNQKNQFSERLYGYGRSLKFFKLLLGGMFWLLFSLLIWFLLFVLDNFIAMPGELRLPFSLAGALVLLVIFIRKLVLPACSKRRLERIAVVMEKKFGIQDNLLINACQFEEREFAEREIDFVNRIKAESNKVLSNQKFWQPDDYKLICRWGIGVLILLVLWGGYITLFPRYASNALQRFSQPLDDLPPVAEFSIQLSPGRNITVSEDEPLRILLELKSSDKGSLRKYSPKLGMLSGRDYLPPDRKSGQIFAMNPVKGKKNCFEYRLEHVKQGFAFRAFAGGTYTKSILVKVEPIPEIIKSVFNVKPPQYTGQSELTFPGPPASLSCLKGSNFGVDLELNARAKKLVWCQGKDKIALAGDGLKWSISGLPVREGSYQLEAVQAVTGRKIVIAEGSILPEDDKIPEIDFVNDLKNRFACLGEVISLRIKAADDYGIQRIQIKSASSIDASEKSEVLKNWTYLGPPGKKEEFEEVFKLKLTPDKFMEGNSYVIQAFAEDFCSSNKAGRSSPIVIRIKTLEELDFDLKDLLGQALNELRKAVVEQRKANSLASNIKMNLPEIWKGKRQRDHVRALDGQQRRSRDYATKALKLLRESSNGKSLATKLDSLVEGEMKLVETDVKELEKESEARALGKVNAIVGRQEYILSELINLLGSGALLADKKNSGQVGKDGDEKFENLSDEDLKKELGQDLKDTLKKYLKAQKKILDASKQLLDQTPEDLTADEEKILGQLAREQAKWSDLFEEKLTDFSKLPLQDFGDGSVAEEFNEVFQEIKKAEKALYEKKIDLAVPHEQSGIENAEELMHNLEKWLPDTPDNIKWSMEEPPAQEMAALAELPDELEDIVGELLDSEEAMTEDVEDVTSSWMDSLDKGAGWDAMDGPISNMSAKGVTGNRLPNQSEIGGRSGEGRTGRSHGQVVEATAQGKGGRKTPTRLTPSPFEQGSIEDSSKEATGGATGGGKLSGFTGEGLRGPAPPKMLQKMSRIAGNQYQIRQKAEKLAARLNAYNISGGELETSINNMKQLETASAKGDGLAVKRLYSRIIDGLDQVKEVLKEERIARREKNKLPDLMRYEIMRGLKDGVPQGYEKMSGEYFKKLAEEEQAK